MMWTLLRRLRAWLGCCVLMSKESKLIIWPGKLVAWVINLPSIDVYVDWKFEVVVKFDAFMLTDQMVAVQIFPIKATSINESGHDSFETETDKFSIFCFNSFYSLLEHFVRSDVILRCDDQRQRFLCCFFLVFHFVSFLVISFGFVLQRYLSKITRDTKRMTYFPSSSCAVCVAVSNNFTQFIQLWQTVKNMNIKVGVLTF